MKNSLNCANQAENSVLPLVSHDIKSLSNAITGMTQALSAELNRPGLHEEQYIRECVQIIRSASVNMNALIDDLVAIGKQQSDSTQIKPCAVYNLSEQLEYARDTFSYEALAKKIELSISVEEDLPVVYWDIDSLRIHAINNLLSNALRHTPVGGKISLSIFRINDDRIAIRVADSGLGVPTSERESLFRRHVKSEKYRKLTGNKHGMGLYNAQRCVQAHGGIIHIVENPAFSGATFQSELPLYSQCIQ